MKHTVKNKNGAEEASICEWSLEFRFKTKEQCAVFFDKLFKTDLRVSASCAEELADRNSLFVCTVEGLWAKNLQIIAEILEEVDYEV
jgi:hypothetical protein